MEQIIENDGGGGGWVCFSDLTGAQDGSVRMFEWGHSQQILCFRSPGNTRVTRIRFNHQGNKVRKEPNALSAPLETHSLPSALVGRSPPSSFRCCRLKASPPVLSVRPLVSPSSLRAQTACSLHESDVVSSPPKLLPHYLLSVLSLFSFSESSFLSSSPPCCFEE